MTLTHDQRKALLLFAKASPFLDAWDLMGKQNNAKRSEILSLLEGKPIPVAKAGVTALELKLFDMFLPEGHRMAMAVARDVVRKKIIEVITQENYRK